MNPERCDALVVGGGPGGLSAALAAAREGVETMLVERYGCFGGVITQALIGTIAWYRSSPKAVDAGGIGTEVARGRLGEGGLEEEDVVPAHVFRVHPARRSDRDFEYYF